MSKIDAKLKIESLALHGGQEADPTNRVARRADLSDDVVSVLRVRSMRRIFLGLRNSATSTRGS